MKRVIPSSPFRPAHTWQVVPFHHIHDAIYRSQGLTSENAVTRKSKFGESSFYDLRSIKATGRGAVRYTLSPSWLALVAAPMEANFYSLACGGGVCSCSTPILCSCSTTSSLTCSLPTSSSSMSRRPILPRFTASARIAKAPIATAPTALAPTAKAPRAVHASPVATLANATCAPNGGCSFRLAVRIFFTILSFPTRLEKTLGTTPFHHNHDAIIRRPV